eukprot:Em0018g1177a
MPGQLYHTNELLVLLGDNWFVERSARDAAAIAERRKQQVIKLLEEEEKQLADWEMRLEFTSDLEGPLKEQGGMVEIREEYTGQGEQEKIRREHTSDPAKRKAHPPLRVSFDPSKAATKTQIDEGLWKRLNELEKEEEEGGKEEVVESGKEEVMEGGKEEVVEGGKEVMEGGKEEVVEGGKEEVVEGGKEVMEGGKEEVMEGGKKGGQEAKGAVHTKSVEAVVVATQGTPTTAEKSSPVSATTTLNAADIGDSCPEQHQPTPLRLLFSHSSSQSIDQPLSRTAEHEHMATSADSSGESCKAVFSSPADIFRSKSMASESVVEKEEKNEDKTSARKSVSWDATLAKAESHRHGHRIEPAVHQAPMGKLWKGLHLALQSLLQTLPERCQDLKHPAKNEILY